MSRPPRFGGAITSSTKRATASPTWPAAAASRLPLRTPPTSGRISGVGPGLRRRAHTTLLTALRSWVWGAVPSDLYRRATSPAFGPGATLTSQGVGVLVFDGGPRPASGAWSIGAYQFGTQAAGVSASG